jgi:hypothetical protein
MEKYFKSVFRTDLMLLTRERTTKDLKTRTSSQRSESAELFQSIFPNWTHLEVPRRLLIGVQSTSEM